MTELQIRRKVARNMIEQMGEKEYREYLYYKYSQASKIGKRAVFREIQAMNFVINHK